MDILALPDVFRRDLMKTMEIKDRLSLRLTCRAFEQLVAESHAGYFRSGAILQDDVGQNSFSFYIGQAKFNDIEATEVGFRECLKLRNRLFNGIEFTSFAVNFGDGTSVLSMEFIQAFTRKFKMDQLEFISVASMDQLETSREIMAWFPHCKFDIRLFFCPGLELLQSLPPLNALTIIDCVTDHAASSWPWQIDSALFFILLGKHTFLNLNNVSISSDDLERIVEIISAERREKYIQILVKNTFVADWLKSRSICQSYKKGDRHGQYEIVCELGQRADMGIRYTNAASRNCFIGVLGNVWKQGHTHITMKNVE